MSKQLKPLTKKQREEQKRAIRDAIEFAGGRQRGLAELITKKYGVDLKENNVSDWLRKGIDPAWVPYVSHATGVAAEKFHPVFELLKSA